MGQGSRATCRAYGDSDCNWARRRLCDSLAGDCLGGEYAISAARSRAAATINLARPILAVVLRTLFGVSAVTVIVWRARMTSLFRPLPSCRDNPDLWLQPVMLVTGKKLGLRVLCWCNTLAGGVGKRGTMGPGYAC